MATIPFEHIPSNLRLPLFWAETSNTQANTGGQNQRALIIGQITSAGLATPNEPLQCLGPSDAITQGGPGSMLALMTQAYLNNDAFGTVYYLPLSDAGGATAASASITFTAAPTAAGTISLYIAGQPVSVPVTASETVAAVATAVFNAINALTSLPVVATNGTAGVVTITAKNAGLCGNDIDYRFNYQGAPNNEFTPAGLTFTTTGTVSGSGYLLAGGATNPTLTTALANLGSQTFDFIASPYTDATSMAAVSAFLNDSTGRWSYQNQLYGHAFMASRGTSGTLTTLGNSMNDQHSTIMGMYDSPTPNWVWAGAVTGAAAASLKVDPALPLQTVAINGVSAPPAINQFSVPTRNTLLWDGISTFTVDQSGVCHIENLITTYQKNGSGVADDSYLEVETMFTIMYVLRALAAVVTSKYARVKLAADGTPIAPGAPIVTPSVIRGDMIAKYHSLCYDDGVCQNPTAFAAGLIVQQNASNPNRVDCLYDPVLIDQLRIFATLMQFRLI
jgi:phage tail sheath gpL-like